MTFEPFDPQQHGKRKVERVLGSIRDELQGLARYSGKILQTGYLSSEVPGCFGETYTPGECCAIAEEQPPVERKYMWGLIKLRETPLRIVVAVQRFSGSPDLVASVNDEEAKDIAKMHLGNYASEFKYPLVWTDDSDWINKLFAQNTQS